MCCYEKFQKINVATWIQWHSAHILDTNTTRNTHIKVTLFYKQNMIFDMFADILNSENHNNCVIGNVCQVSGFCWEWRKLFSQVRAVKNHISVSSWGEKGRFNTLSHVTENSSFTWLNFNLFSLRGQEEKNFFLPLPPCIKCPLREKAQVLEGEAGGC